MDSLLGKATMVTFPTQSKLSAPWLCGVSELSDPTPYWPSASNSEGSFLTWEKMKSFNLILKTR